MKICRFKFNQNIITGVIQDRKVFVLENNKPTDQSFDFEEINLLSPVEPSKIVCVGRNYVAHAAELGNDVPKEPLLFLKAPSSLIKDGDSIVLPTQSTKVEHEAELAVIIGRKCKNLLSSDDSFDYVAGYTILNDVTARDLQKQDVQFTRAKSFDTFCPIASFIETDFDSRDARLTTKVNGEIRQDGRTSQMIFSVDFLVKYISRQMTLNAGDIIATGTPSGVSQLNAGDVCEIEIEGIGSLSNPVCLSNFEIE
jgi:2-keto-4-pentenoate hydratase/2-oxohepta-3-ene-1,7-dioic acid hydratase in catechol pathway